jgi:predicted  nucleic acid-binding Zn-ribbon protein
MSDDNMATVDKRLLAQLIESITNVSDQVAQLREQMARMESQRENAKDEWEQLAKDVRCVSKGVAQFKDRFEPYLVSAVESQREWRDRRSSLVTKVLGVGVLGALGIVAAAVWHYVLDIVSTLK